MFDQMSPTQIAEILASKVENLSDALKVAQARGYWDCAPGSHYNPQAAHTDQVSFEQKSEYKNFSKFEIDLIEQAYRDGWKEKEADWVGVEL